MRRCWLAAAWWGVWAAGAAANGAAAGTATGTAESRPANLLANPDMSQRDGGGVVAWSFSAGHAGLFESVTDGPRRAIRFRAPGAYSTASQSVRLKGDARYRLMAEVKGTAGIYLRARTAPAKGAATIPYTVDVPPGPEYRRATVSFPTGPTGEVLVLIGNTERGGKGEAFIAGLRLVEVSEAEASGPAIRVEPSAGVATVIQKLAVADCRALRGFIGAPVDGTTASRDWSGGVWEYNQRGAGAGVGYAYRNNDGLHITLADGGGFHAIQVRGGAAARVFADCPRCDEPTGGRALAELPGGTDRSRAWLPSPAVTTRVSFFDVSEGRLADVSFFRIRRGGEALPAPRRLVLTGPCQPGPVEPWLKEQYGKDGRRAFSIRPAQVAGEAIRMAKGQVIHLLGEPTAEETALAAVGLDFVVALADKAPAPPGAEGIPLTLTVHDPLNPRSRILETDIVLARAGRCRVVLDFPDQVVPKEAVLWLSIALDAAADVSAVAAETYGVPRQRALAEALEYRKLLLKTYFCCLSEPRPWNGWYDQARVDKSLADPRWGPQLKELLMTLDQCKALGPQDDLVRQYDEWIWRNYRPRRSGAPAAAPRIDAVPGAPEWAVVARQAWLTARQVPRWWIENRMVPTGEFGGEVGDDTDMYQNFADFPMLEDGGVGAAVKDGAARLAELAERQNLTAGLNRQATDPLHAYEEGLNHEALMAWWNYGEPVYLERCMTAARSTESLTVVTPKGHRHFKSQECGAADLTMDRKTDIDGHAHPLMWHPTFEVAWYNRNPRAMKNLVQWADGWLEHMAPGKYATSVEVATERITETTDRPLYGGYGGQGSAFLFLYWITGEDRYLKPFFEQFSQGRRNTSPDLILPELIHRHGLGFLGDRLRQVVRGDGAAETLITGDKRPLIDALKRDIAELQRFPAMYTTAEPFTDRVFLYAIRNAAIAYSGGYAARNKYNHTHAVSWEGFGTGFAALVLAARPDRLKVLAYGFADKPMSGRMRVWTLQHGQYRLRVGPDADGDDRIDQPVREEMVELLRASPVALTLPPGQVTVVELEQARPGDDERLRADLALSPLEVRVEGGIIHAIAHNIGSKTVDSFDVALIDEAGKVRARKTLGPLDAPLDLAPRRVPFALDAPGPLAKGWSLVLDPEDRIPEVYEGNNRLAVP